ncbi:UNVERIFIED_CONTAM: hypothetical protein Sradi_0008200 [Sesamum radiatum]|uniref:Uncharacterized protein n=1 Tax=Sesamum radiatum TaxID=300843 RepID=A0AAW2WGQ7_SESRA
MACTRLDSARVCVMLDISSKLPKHLAIMVPNKDGSDTPYMTDVEYEPVPPKCVKCSILGHSATTCPIVKQTAKQSTKPPINIYVQRSDMAKTVVSPSKSREDHNEIPKFLMLLGYKQAYCPDGNGLLTTQPEDVLVTVVYGANDWGAGHALWRDLSQLAQTIDVPWLVSEDFNTILDMSEVCCASGDIRMAMDEFQECLNDTSLIHLPMQGERFTWHNYSSDSRSLWKMLDRILVNDWWLERWPNASYLSLNPLTSDHLPLLLKVDTTHNVSLFCFDNYLALFSKFTPTVQNVWQHHIVGTTMYSETCKLKALKPEFQRQRRNKGDLPANVTMAAAFLDMAQTLLQIDRHNSFLLHLEYCYKLVFLKATKLEQVM